MKFKFERVGYIGPDYREYLVYYGNNALLGIVARIETGRWAFWDSEINKSCQFDNREDCAQYIFNRNFVDQL